MMHLKLYESILHLRNFDNKICINLHKVDMRCWTTGLSCPPGILSLGTTWYLVPGDALLRGRIPSPPVGLSCPRGHPIHFLFNII